ncbi:unnamed protein product [Ectocarpus sp. CCAP 1310/34]|nr:unnamed protein product [Ectocarpus sp. CCAP 1310/34]
MTTREPPSTISGLKTKYFQHVLDVSSTEPSLSSSSSSEAAVRWDQPTRRTECTCRTTMMGCTCWGDTKEAYPSDEDAPSTTHVLRTPPPVPSSSDALAKEALSILSQAEKDRIILLMHAKLRHLSHRAEDARSVSERKVCCLERAHRDALRERMLSEQRLREELRQWKHHHPEVAELRLENQRLREEKDHSQRQYLAVLGKLARRHTLLKKSL